MPPLPDDVAELWNAFSRLSTRRPQTGFGPAAITYQDIAAFERATRVRFTSWEIETIEELDAAWLLQRADDAKKTTEGPSASR